ncbi:MAG: hypothetical protein KC505_02885 [Myxococcales bacterium]|nr:hypothetical protein [Myxococcales bacterium]USN51706.1 MAG: hypothetical protein H6731_04670 [Myxococcales bacterium]
MVIGQVVHAKKTAVGVKSTGGSTSFKELLNSKQKEHSIKSQHQGFGVAQPLKKVINEMVDNHKLTTQALKSSRVRSSYAPEKLLNFQYKVGFLLLKQQMFARTAESCASTLKNFTQMQV